jgi:predicted ATPase
MMLIVDNDNGPKWVSEELYGREEHLELLNRLAAERSSGCVVLHGGEGTGKTSIMEALPWDENDWVFVSGKYEEHHRAQPYSVLIGALDNLVEVWSVNDSKGAVCQMGEFYKLLDDDIELLQNVVPGIFRIVEKFSCRKYVSKKNSLKDLQKLHQDPAKEYMAGDSVAVTAAFLRIFSFLSSARPVVLFLDDLHHADAASLDIIELMAYAAASNLSSNKNHLLLVVSYRDEEVEKNKFATKTVKSIQDFESKNVHTLHLKDLHVESVNELVASLVNSEADLTLPLSTVIHKKTAGNPFFVAQFLRYAREKGFFTFSQLTYKWEWGDVDALEEYASVSDNVADMLAMSMDKLCIATQVVLKVSSCLGKIIPKDVLVEHFRSYDEEGQGHTSCAAVVGVQARDLDNLLDNAVKAGILVKSMTQGAYMWSNNRLQHVAYSFIPPSLRIELHMKIGRLLWKLGLERDEEWMIFMAASQMNIYAGLQCDSSLGNEVAKLNLQAAKLSLNKAAIFPAHEMLVNAVKHMVMGGRWVKSYDLTLDILTNLAETKMMVGELDEAVEIAHVIVDNAQSLDDKFRAYLVLLQGLVSSKERNFDLGIEKTLELLKLYGEKNPKRFFPGQKCVEKKKLKKMLPGGELEGLLELPDMVDETALKVQTLLVDHLGRYATMSQDQKSLAWFASVRVLKNACKYGISPVTNMAVIQLAIQLRIEGHYKEASEYADFALLLSERIPRKLGSNHGMARFVAVTAVFSAVRQKKPAYPLFLCLLVPFLTF